NLDAATSYTMLVEAENIYGEKKLVESAPFTTDAIDYKGELVPGDYVMRYTYVDEEEGESYLFENVFTIKPTVGSDTNFFVGDFGIEGYGINWYAVYDASASTLTLSGVWKGNETKGSFLGGWIGVSASEAVLVASYASEDSDGKDPIVIKVDPSTKQPVGLETDVEAAEGKLVGSNVSPQAYYMYYADGTTIAPYVESAAAKASVKPMSVRPVKVPFSSVRVPAQSRKVVAARDNFASEMTMAVCDTRTADTGCRTLSVKTAKCEPLPKQLTRKADFKMAANAGSLVME
ncbi:MAG: hypothetical protein K2H42_00515, partial [Alistipes sp.]|nr:hypothetical protein [Alistipes sp.]